MSSKYWDIPMNFIGGCSPCNKGCTHCWAADCASKRLANHPLYKGLTKNGKWTGKVRVMPELIKVIGGKPKTIFWCNMSDMFHEKAAFEDIDKAFGYMVAMPKHKHLVLTKRIKRASEYFASLNRGIGEFPNIHLGVTICTPDELWKAEELIKIPAAHRWLSIEPMLENINIVPYLLNCGTKGLASIIPPRIGRAIVGCESGPKRRPCKLEWFRSIVRQCKAAGVGCFVKQIEINGKVSHNPAEWPEWAQVRETI